MSTRRVRDDTPSDDGEVSSAADDSQLGSDEEEAVVAQWVDEDELDGMVDSEEDEFADEKSGPPSVSSKIGTDAKTYV